MWLALQNLILNPSKYIILLNEFDVYTAEAVLTRHGILEKEERVFTTENI